MSARGTNLASQEKADPRVKRTRELLVRAFTELASEKGHRSLTVREIAERATVNRATFYAHFRDQYELLDYVISEAFRDEVWRRLPESPGLNRKTLKALILVTCNFLYGLEVGCGRSDRQVRPLVEAQVQGVLYELLLGWAEESGKNGWTATPKATAVVVSWAIFGVGLEWSRDRTSDSAEKVADQAMSMIVEGIRV